MKIKNDKQGKYEFDIHRKIAITNVQVKKHSCHDPGIQKGIIKGFVNRALTICSDNHIDDELKFLTDVFVENGYQISEVQRAIAEVKDKQRNSTESLTQTNNNGNKPVITLPWIPSISPKLRKAYKKAGYRAVFKSGNNLKNILCSKNKMKLPRNSYPGIYKVDCKCKKTYTGETKLKVSTRGKQHVRNVIQNKIDTSGIVLHTRICNKGIDWDSLKTLKVEPKRFDRKVREALDIQYNRCGPKQGGMNLDDGQYVKTKFWTPFFRFLRNRECDVNKAAIPTSHNNADTTLPSNGH